MQTAPNKSIFETPEVSSVQFLKLEPTEDYADILKIYGLKYKRTDYYLEIGELPWEWGWVLDISAIQTQVISLLEVVIPLLVKEKVSFKIPRSSRKAHSILNGELGWLLMGKIITIYPSDIGSAIQLIRHLIQLTQGYKGPEIPTDLRLSGVIYTRYDKSRHVTSQQEIDAEKLTNEHDIEGPRLQTQAFPTKVGKNIAWPFSEFSNPNTLVRETVLQDKYKPIYTLKDDPKGTVRKGLWLKKIYHIKWCIIKEGKQNMVSDIHGRDMVDRLRWQFELHKKLEGLVPLPKIYDFFIENGDGYLVMEYIRGVPLRRKIVDAFQGKIWSQLPENLRRTLLDYILQILNIIGVMHTNGFIHRDITTSNFLVNKSQDLCLIDLELSYSLDSSHNSPPFRLGTPGFMSPEQQEGLTPTVKQDIYAIGAILLEALTGFPPDDFALVDNSAIKEQLNFFIGDSQIQIIDLIADCLNPDPDLRPEISTIKRAIQHFQYQQPETLNYQTLLHAAPAQKVQVKTLIEHALDALNSPDMLNVHKIWTSQGHGEDGADPSFAKPITAYEGLAIGAAGPVWLLSKAHELQFSVGPSIQCYENTVGFIRNRACSKKSLKGGLYFGTAGFAMALLAGIKSGLIVESTDLNSEIKSWLANKDIQGCGIATGLAGRGMVLLQAASVLGNNFIGPLLFNTIDKLIELQETDGSWKERIDKNNRSIKPTGFSHGVAGIACFMLCYLKQFENDVVRQSTTRAMQWLVRQAHKKRGHTRWRLHNKSMHSVFGFENGCMGIVLCLIKAYEVIGDIQFKELACDCMNNLPAHMLSNEISLAGGLSGHGEVFLEAAKILGEEWQERVDWIAQFLINYHAKESGGAIYWKTERCGYPTADLFTGNSGIIHFLLRYYQPQKLDHPLLSC